MTQIELRGFIGPWDSVDGSLDYFRPAFTYENQLFYAVKDNWSLNDTKSYRQVQSGEEGYLIEVDPKPTINDGDLIWVCTQAFFFSCQHGGRRLAPIQNEMKSWDSFARGSRRTSGNLDDYIRFSNSAYNRAVGSLENQLFDEMSKRSGSLDETFKVVDRLIYRDTADPYTPKLHQHIERAMYYHETRDFDNYELVRHDALSTFPELGHSQEEFDRRVTERLDFLKQDRLSQIDVAGSGISSSVSEAPARAHEIAQSMFVPQHFSDYLTLADRETGIAFQQFLKAKTSVDEKIG